MAILYRNLINEQSGAAYDIGTLGKTECVAGRASVVDDPLGLWGKVARLELRASDPPVNGSHRCQLQTPIAGCVATPGTYWHWMSFMVPTDYADFQRLNPVTRRVTIQQLHDAPDAGDPARMPIMSMAVIERDGVEWLSCDQNAEAAGNTFSYRPVTFEQKLVRGHWYEVVWKWVLDASGSNGRWTLWFDRRRVFYDIVSPNSFTDVAPAWWMADTYSSDATLGDWMGATYHRGVIVGDSSYATFNAFMSACGFSGQELEPPTAFNVSKNSEQPYF